MNVKNLGTSVVEITVAAVVFKDPTILYLIHNLFTVYALYSHRNITVIRS